MYTCCEVLLQQHENNVFKLKFQFGLYSVDSKNDDFNLAIMLRYDSTCFERKQHVQQAGYD